MQHADFVSTVWNFYEEHGRHDLPWRNTSSTYAIFVSEVMLQQTQATRVVPKYLTFLKKFPTPQALAQASTAEVIREWKGLGYNRRALNLKHTAERITLDFDGHVPREKEALTSLPGIGSYTAAAVQAFAFNIPTTVIETNIRTVFIKHFFTTSTKKISDKDILPLIETTIDESRPREWYWALMDYGAHLKKIEGNLSRRSSSYTRQSQFKGSNRENRSQIISLLLETPHTESEILITLNDKRTKDNLENLVHEGFVVKAGENYQIQ